MSDSWTEPRVPWTAPAPYGFPFALDSMGGVAAPLLAGFSLTMIGLSINKPEALRWPNYTFVFLATAFTLLIFAVQFAFWAKMFWVTPSQAKEWWPDFEDNSERRRLVYKEVESYDTSRRLWSIRSRLSYNIAICFLMLGLVTVLFPQGNHIGVARWIAVGVVVFGLLAEVLWILRTPIERLRRRNPTQALAEAPQRRGIASVEMANEPIHTTKRSGGLL